MRWREFMAGPSLTATMRPVRAQQSGKACRIAVVHLSHPTTDLSETGRILFFQAFFNELCRLGYVEGQNLMVKRYSGEGRTERHAEIARDAVRSNPDLIFASSSGLYGISRQLRIRFQLLRSQVTRSLLDL